MDKAALFERVERVVATRADVAAPVDTLAFALGGVRELRSFLSAAEADLARRLAAAVVWPEAVLAESSKESLHQASKTMGRAATLDAVPALADALDATTVTAGHVDAVTRASKLLDGDQRDELFERVGEIVDVAAAGSVEAFGRRVRHEARRIAAAAGVDRLGRQLRDTVLSSWVDPEGMWNLRGRFDPVTGMKLNARLDAAVEALFANAAPESCPADPIAKQQHLKALALARLLDGTAGGAGRGRSGRPEFVAVIDIAAGPGTATGDEAGWNIGLGANRELTVTFPDGTVRNTGPPNRRAA